MSDRCGRPKDRRGQGGGFRESAQRRREREVCVEVHGSVQIIAHAQPSVTQSKHTICFSLSSNLMVSHIEHPSPPPHTPISPHTHQASADDSKSGKKKGSPFSFYKAKGGSEGGAQGGSDDMPSELSKKKAELEAGF